jgi:hypothetical protein
MTSFTDDLEPGLIRECVAGDQLACRQVRDMFWDRRIFRKVCDAYGRGIGQHIAMSSPDPVPEAFDGKQRASAPDPEATNIEPWRWPVVGDGPHVRDEILAELLESLAQGEEADQPSLLGLLADSEGRAAALERALAVTRHIAKVLEADLKASR